MTRLDTVEQAVADIAAGKAVVVIDDEDRENEGDLICAAQFATTGAIDRLRGVGRGAAFSRTRNRPRPSRT